VSQFAFLQGEWAAVFESAARAEAAVHADPRTSCFYARRALELAVGWAYKHDASLRLPYQDNLSALIHDPSFKEAAGEAVFSKARGINTLLTFAMLTLASTATRPQAGGCLKMADEGSRPPLSGQMSQPSPIPAAYAWPALPAKDGDALFDHDRHTLEDLGKQPGTLALIFGKAGAA
jgi:hypothetical protein